MHRGMAKIFGVGLREPVQARRVFLFSGQGSQTYAMAADLYRHNPEFRRHLTDLDARFQAILGHSVVSVLYGGAPRSEPLSDILISHPAIFMVEYALAQVMIGSGLTPEAVVGASLGEIAAATIAGSIPLGTAVSLVANQARVFSRAPQRGGMVAVLHDLEAARSLGLFERGVELAAVNYDSNFVVTGDAPALASVKALLRQRGIAFQELPVSYAFHSSLLDDLREQLSWPADEAVSTFGVPFWSCSAAGLVDRLDTDHFWRVLRHRVRLHDTIALLEAEGPCDYIDVGPAGSFATAVKRILAKQAAPASRLFPLLNPFSSSDREIQNVVNACRPMDAGRAVAVSAVDPGGEGPPRARPTPWERWLERAPESPADSHRALIFPGQGSQAKGMGAALFDAFADLTAIADETLGYSIRRLCVEDPDKQLGQTQFTQPALYVVNALTYLKQRCDGAARPAFVAGHSLGEYNALLAAGVFDFQVGLHLVKKRGELMSQASGGGMAAVIGLDVEGVAAVLREDGLDLLDIANLNSPLQTVISGPVDSIKAARQSFKTRNARYVPLDVSAAFHSRYMESAAGTFGEFLSGFSFVEVRTPVVSNVTARPYEAGQTRKNLTDQLRMSVQWVASIRYLLNHGVSHFEELGPGRRLTDLVTQIQRTFQGTNGAVQCSTGSATIGG